MLETAKEVFDTLGGLKAVAELTGHSYEAVSKWSEFKRFPPDTYVILTGALRERGKEAPPSLWRMISAEPEQAAP